MICWEILLRVLASLHDQSTIRASPASISTALPEVARRNFLPLSRAKRSPEPRALRSTGRCHSAPPAHLWQDEVQHRAAMGTHRIHLQLCAAQRPNSRRKGRGTGQHHFPSAARGAPRRLPLLHALPAPRGAQNCSDGGHSRSGRHHRTQLCSLRGMDLGTEGSETMAAAQGAASRVLTVPSW